MAPYLLAFCRVVLGLVFLYAFIGKASNLAQFKQTITDFRLLPARMSASIALLFVSCECFISISMLVGGMFLLPGFLLTILLLLVFSSALSTVLLRGQHTHCNCFGVSSQAISAADLWRNGGLLLCAAIGIGVHNWFGQGPHQLGVLEWLLVVLGSGIFVLLWTQLNMLVQLFR